MEIEIETTVRAPRQKVWDAWTTPSDITAWNFASPEWVCPNAKIDLVEGGRFSYRMEARDGSMGFDFSGVFMRVVEGELIEFEIDDGRKTVVGFEGDDGAVRVTERFEADEQHSAEQQRSGWQRILDNFKKHVEAGHER